MFIDPMQSLDTISQLNQIQSEKVKAQQQMVQDVAGDEVQVPFKSIFESAIQDVIDTDRQVNIDAEMLATGESDNLHQYSIYIAKAQLSVDLLVQMRNKALEAYSEVMRMSV